MCDHRPPCELHLERDDATNLTNEIAIGLVITILGSKMMDSCPHGVCVDAECDLRLEELTQHRAVRPERSRCVAVDANLGHSRSGKPWAGLDA